MTVAALRFRDLRSGFALRLLLSVAGVLLLAGGIGYQLVTVKLRRDLVSRGVQSQRELAEQLTARAASRGSMVQKEFADIVRELSLRPESIAVLVLDPAGNVLTSGGRSLDDPARDRLVAEVFRSGEADGGYREAEESLPARFQLAAPVAFGLNQYALVVEQDTSVLEGQVDAVRSSMLLVGAPLGVLVVGLVWVFGGWALSARYRIARDGLTDLGNHRAFRDELERACAGARRGSGDPALLVIDLDGFKAVNDRHGHGHGDALLRRVAMTMLASCRPEDRLFRTGGDEFAILLPRVTEADAAVAAGRVLDALAAAGTWASIGVSAARPMMRQAQQLREEADAALYEAKRLGRHQAVAFLNVRHEVALRSPAKGDAVRQLIEADAMSVAFQPIWDITEGRLVGVEALCRPHKRLGLAGPADAFDIAEQLNLVATLDRACLRAAFDAARGLPTDVLLFVNVAPLTLETATTDDFAWAVRGAVACGIAPGQVVVEVTERLGARRHAVLQGAEKLRELGFRLALDDVGTGDAGLDMLRSFDVDFVKVDRAVITTAPVDGGARAVLAAIAAFAHERGVFIIAEGIEDPAALEYLRDSKYASVPGKSVIRGGQGYGLGRPQPSLNAALELARTSKPPSPPIQWANRQT